MSKYKGSCLCEDVQFEVNGPIKGLNQCHCSLCRKVSGASNGSIFVVQVDQFRWIKGEQATTKYVYKNKGLPNVWSVLRCNVCGSPLPQSYDGKHFWVRAGLMDNPLGIKVEMNHHVSSKADWVVLPDNVPQFDVWPDHKWHFKTSPLSGLEQLAVEISKIITIFPFFLFSLLPFFFICTLSCTVNFSTIINYSKRILWKL